MTHEIGHILGLGHVNNPNNIMYPYMMSHEYGVIGDVSKLAKNYGSFLPLCTIRDNTSFNYYIDSDDPKFGFDVYFVSSKDEFNKWLKTGSFNYIKARDCSAENMISVGGTCKDVSTGNGLLILMGEKTSKPITEISVKLEENYDGSNPLSNIVETQDTSASGSTPTPTPTPTPTSTQTTQQQTQQTKKGGCLIATAAFGSEMAPQVQLLREIRDNTVLQTESGSAFMTGFNQFYYSFSPAVADYERENPAFKEAVKIMLTPLLISLTLLQYADIDSESEMLGYGISIILLNIGMYFVAPAVLLMKIRKRI
jgi:hypothetical protein